MAKKRKNPDAHMSDEWIDLHEGHESPLFWVDLSAESQLSVVQDKLTRLERKAISLINKPKKLIKRVRSRLTRN